ncbi:MAG: DUF1150 domain-containing protein [Rhodobacteraceae bacterium]|nr:DUF1150 domain-containing protein [Paracoccaceae bacterium]
MNTKYSFGPRLDNRLVYVRAVDVADLPKDLQDQADGAHQIYAVHSADGERLALVRDREMAFVLARQNEYAPVTVH